MSTVARFEISVNFSDHPVLVDLRLAGKRRHACSLLNVCKGGEGIRARPRAYVIIALGSLAAVRSYSCLGPETTFTIASDLSTLRFAQYESPQVTRNEATSRRFIAVPTGPRKVIIQIDAPRVRCGRRVWFRTSPYDSLKRTAGSPRSFSATRRSCAGT